MSKDETAAFAERLRLVAQCLNNPNDCAIVREFASEIESEYRSEIGNGDAMLAH